MTELILVDTDILIDVVNGITIAIERLQSEAELRLAINMVNLSSLRLTGFVAIALRRANFSWLQTRITTRILFSNFKRLFFNPFS